MVIASHRQVARLAIRFVSSVFTIFLPCSCVSLRRYSIDRKPDAQPRCRKGVSFQGPGLTNLSLYQSRRPKRHQWFNTTVVVFSAALRCACNAHVSPALDVSVAIGTTLRPVPAQDSLSIPTTRLGDALPALLEV